MPALHWIGKDKVVNHHQDVPFRVLCPQYHHGAPATAEAPAHRLLHGDNLEALKALLPEYEGRVHCIYIDPPYNTGNEGWVYNDNVNDPKLKKWLGQVVGKESEDLSRHDKWLCMMYPRLKLLHKLLAEDGSIWISIDDNEQANLKLVLDEIFGANNFLANIAWEKRFTRSNNAKLFYSLKDSILAYRKTPAVSYLREGRTEKADALYTNPDNDSRGVWISSSYVNPATKEKRKNLVYPITNPNTGEEITHPTHAWKYGYPQYEEHVKDNRLYWGTEGKNPLPRLKSFLTDAQGMVPVDIWYHKETGTTDDGGKTLTEIFEGKGTFDTPKPVGLIEKILHLATHPDSIVLDSFAGSGTTGHAVLKLNAQDGGRRQCLLIELEAYAETITAERLRRVVAGYGAVPGTGGGFGYYTLGAALFTDGGDLNEAVGLPALRQYLYYTETRQPLPAPPAAAPAPAPAPAPEAEAEADTPALLGCHGGAAYYFHYAPDAATTLDYEFLSTVRTRAEQYIIYADNCLLPADFLRQRRIVFKKIPRDVTRF